MWQIVKGIVSSSSIMLWMHHIYHFGFNFTTPSLFIQGFDFPFSGVFPTPNFSWLGNEPQVGVSHLRLLIIMSSWTHWSSESAGDRSLPSRILCGKSAAESDMHTTFSHTCPKSLVSAMQPHLSLGAQESSSVVKFMISMGGLELKV